MNKLQGKELRAWRKTRKYKQWRSNPNNVKKYINRCRLEELINLKLVSLDIANTQIKYWKNHIQITDIKSNIHYRYIVSKNKYYSSEDPKFKTKGTFDDFINHIKSMVRTCKEDEELFNIINNLGE